MSDQLEKEALSTAEALKRDTELPAHLRYVWIERWQGISAHLALLEAENTKLKAEFARLRDGLETLIAKRVSYYTYAKSGGCAKCADRLGSRYEPVPGHKPDCPIKALTEARERGDWETICMLLAELR